MNNNVIPLMSQKDWDMMCKIVEAVEKAGLNINDVEDFFVRLNPMGEKHW